MTKPKNIVIVRHGESEGNAYPEVRKTKPDYSLDLTLKGRVQARDAGETLMFLGYQRKWGIYCSPYFRTKQTLFEIKKFLTPSQIAWSHEDPRLREQEWGNFEGPTERDFEEERNRFGSFFYRFPSGESGADVYDRCSGFLDTLYRDFEKPTCPDNILIVSHGFTMRVLLARWLHIDFTEFQKLKNPPNCGMYSLCLNKDSQKYEVVNGVQYYEDDNRIPFVYRDEANSPNDKAS